MTISELGSLGEFIASAAVVATLFLLIAQIRGARREFSNQTTREIKQRNSDTFHQLTADPELMSVHIRAQRDFSSLDETEQARWLVWMFTWINQTELGYCARRDGVEGMDWVDTYLMGIASVLRSPGGQVAAARLARWYEPDFVEELGRKVVAGSETWLEMLLTDLHDEDVLVGSGERAGS